MNTAFHTEPISPTDWLFIIGVGAALFIIIELLKTIHNVFCVMKIGQIDTLRRAQSIRATAMSKEET